MDLVKCLGAGCLLTETCSRYTTDPNTEHFADAPFVIINNNFSCPMYWGKEQIAIFDSLINATNGETNTGGSSETNQRGAKEDSQGSGEES